MATINSLARLSEALQALPDLRREAMVDASLKINDLMRKQFAAGTDPYGAKWAPLRPRTIAKGRHAPPLTDTGIMRDSIQYQASAEGLHITVHTPAEYHQHGTKHMVARKILPENSLPQSWEIAIQEALDKAAKRAMGDG